MVSSSPPPPLFLRSYMAHSEHPPMSTSPWRRFGPGVRLQARDVLGTRLLDMRQAKERELANQGALHGQLLKDKGRVLERQVRFAQSRPPIHRFTDSSDSPIHARPSS